MNTTVMRKKMVGTHSATNGKGRGKTEFYSHLSKNKKETVVFVSSVNGGGKEKRGS